MTDVHIPFTTLLVRLSFNHIYLLIKAECCSITFILCSSALRTPNNGTANVKTQIKDEQLDFKRNQ